VKLLVSGGGPVLLDARQQFLLARREASPRASISTQPSRACEEAFAGLFFFPDVVPDLLAEHRHFGIVELIA